MKSIGIVGCGAIGRTLLKGVDTGVLTVKVAGVNSSTEDPACQFLPTLRDPPPFLDRSELIKRSDIVVEAVGGEIVGEVARETFQAGKDLMVISAGALLDHPDIIELSRTSGCQLFVPSGAIAGLEGIKSACKGAVEHVRMTTLSIMRTLQDIADPVRIGT